MYANGVHLAVPKQNGVSPVQDPAATGSTGDRLSAGPEKPEYGAARI
jgi:hypothetical protein